MSDNCPVCGKGDYTYTPHERIEVSHLDCVRREHERAEACLADVPGRWTLAQRAEQADERAYAAEANLTKASSDWKLEQQRRLEAEAEVERLREELRSREHTCGQFEADLRKQEAIIETNRVGWKNAADENESLRGVLRALFIREHDFWLGWDKDREREFTDWLLDLARRYEEAHRG